MANHTFFCIDGHTCGNPVRVVAGGAPPIPGQTMIEKRQHFLEHTDWIRTSLMFEPRGHDMMSGTIPMASTRPDCDVALLFIETSGCLPMCGHGTIGTVTILLERGLVTPRTPGVLMLDTPAGVVKAEYQKTGDYVDWVRITNVASYLHATGVEAHVPGLGDIRCDIAYGGNFYAIVDPQPGFDGLEHISAGDVLRWSPLLRDDLNRRHTFVHREEPKITGLRHVMWTGKPTKPTSTARNAVFYGDKAIDRSPCGTGTSARLAQWAAKGLVTDGDRFVHESIIGSEFVGRIAERTTVGGVPAIRPSIEGWAKVTGFNTILVDDRDPYWRGFSVL